ncbi:MAG: hypothetical protein NTY22_04065 [Proteobacteria bacterium]|nr:hypothetical protein [Pseudomonadota bacterium]
MRFLFITFLLPLMTSNIFSQNLDSRYSPEVMKLTLYDGDRVASKDYSIGYHKYVVTLTPGDCDKALKTRDYYVIFVVDEHGVEFGDVYPYSPDREVGIKSKITKDPLDNGNYEITIEWEAFKDSGKIKITPVMLTTNDSKSVYAGIDDHNPIYFEDHGHVTLLAKPNGELTQGKVVDEEDCPDKTGSKINVSIKELK